MKTRLIRSGLLLCGAIVAIAGYDVWATAQEEPTTTDAAPSASADDSDASKKEDLQIQFAQAHVRLMQLEIQKADEANSRVPGTIPRFMMEQLRGELGYAQGRLNQAKGLHDEHSNPYRELALSKLRLGEENLRKAELANRMNANTVSPTEVARRRAIVEIERLRVELADKLDLTDPSAVMQWELDELHDEMTYLRIITARLIDRN
ncbi:MAG: hypothetical protein AB7U73_25655 [Pirellulales bacterium]